MVNPLPRGLILSEGLDGKTTVWSSGLYGVSDILGCDIPRAKGLGTKLLGAAVGSSEFAEELLVKRVDKSIEII